ncbi:hypothetical protein [Streptomyces adonidis]|uniref:hypothetical protein n=1 Tax=Streptomyces adonidis TaxID=3231367 RepID=UPI0034DB74DC
MESEERSSDPDAKPATGKYISELSREPSPNPGCADCLSLSVARENARSIGDFSAVSDMNVKLRRHLTQAHES